MILVFLFSTKELEVMIWTTMTRPHMPMSGLDVRRDVMVHATTSMYPSPLMDSANLSRDLKVFTRVANITGYKWLGSC